MTPNFSDQVTIFLPVTLLIIKLYFYDSIKSNKQIVLSVNLNITDVAATAEITLLGANASGNTTVQISQNVLPLARQFGAVKFWVGFQHRATFFVDDIIVTRKNQ